MSEPWYKENICIYEHPKHYCGGKDDKSLRRRCKYFPDTGNECGYFNINDIGDCGCFSAQLEYWYANQKPE